MKVDTIAFKPQTIKVIYKLNKKKRLIEYSNFIDSKYKTFFGGSDGSLLFESFVDTNHILSSLEIDLLRKVASNCLEFNSSIITSQAIENLSNNIEQFINDGNEIFFIITENNGHLNLFGKNNKECIKIVKKFFSNYLKNAQESKIYLIDFRYLQTDKVEGLYAQVVDRIETSSGKELETKKKWGFKSKINLGSLLSVLGIDIGMDHELDYENANSIRVNYSLSPIQKFMIVYETLAKTRQLSYLNHDLQLGSSPEKFVKFKGDMKYIGDMKYSDVISNINSDFHKNTDTDMQDILAKFPLKFSLKINSYRIEFVCFEGFFKLSPNSRIPLILDKKIIEIEGLASIINFDLKEKQIILSPIALW